MGGGQSHNQQGPQGPSSSHGPNNGSVLATKKQQHENANKCSPAKVKSCLRTFFAHLFSHIGLCILIVGYTIAGALMFEKLEKTYEMKLIGNRTANFKKLRLHYVSELWNITEQFNVLYEMNWTSAVEKELREFESRVVATANTAGYSDVKDDLHWTFSGALLYSVSIITTIGYGNTAPRTAWGKILTMFYAVIGVPLMLLWLSNIGTLMANTFKFAYSHACCISSNPSSSSRSVQTKRTPSSKTEPSSIQVKYSVSAMTCETQVVQAQQNMHQRALNRREQRAKLRSLDPSAKQVLMECAEYNVNMDQDERSRRILHQLHSDSGGNGGEMLNISGMDEESSDEVESVIDMRGVTRGGDQSDLRGLNGGRGGSVMEISVNSNGMEGTPSRIPLLHHKGGGVGGIESGPDLVEVDEYHCGGGGSGSDGSASPSLNKYHLPRTEQRVPVSLVLTFVVLYIMGGAAVFSVWEKWGFLDSAYFCFITLSTIGLGDYVPGVSFGSAGTKEGQAQLIVCCLYLVLGLAIIAMSFNLVQEEVAAKVKDIARHIGIIKDNPEH
ncbi:potassium channel subfamily K member 18-like [Folsomia candida]|uniref:potassium channel subfamily K member 18-like n=1 Tax=Folsomia candida TaxID=158441 RepID=UPI001604FE0D|nr:potassium channel subfamily K member 18-like [Folsomia candida]